MCVLAHLAQEIDGSGYNWERCLEPVELAEVGLVPLDIAVALSTSDTCRGARVDSGAGIKERSTMSTSSDENGLDVSKVEALCARACGLARVWSSRVVGAAATRSSLDRGITESVLRLMGPVVVGDEVGEERKREG